MIVLVGFMGAGKTTVGRALAERLRLSFVDVDAAVEARAGTSIPELFARDGEAAFRRLESEVTQELLRGPDGVVALGGGALNDPAITSALEWATVVHLDVSFGESMRRVGRSTNRPMLQREDPRALFDARRASYERAADLTVAVDRRSPREIVDEIVARAAVAPAGGPVRVSVALGERSYDVIVGEGVADRLAELAPPPADAEKAFVVTHPELEPAASGAVASLSAAGLKTHTLTVPAGERSKSLAHATDLLSQLADLGAHRRDLVVGFGGGVVTDLAGFVASTYHRGMAVVHVATTLLAQVDAAIGGKTAVNLAQGKNLVGTFHQPRAVVCDVATLRTLPPAELAAGLAEVVKYGVIADPGLLEVVEKWSEDVFGFEPQVLTDVVGRSAAIKAAVVARDETEGGPRAHLNYGHTFGHAMEHVTAAGAAPLRHGEAVALGMMAAAYTAHELGRIDEAAVAAHRSALEAARLPVAARFDLGELEEAWRHDKKYRRGVRFVLLAGLGRPEAGVEVDRATLETALRRLAG
ncbi:MAG TPA: 3-dehydroquinate synthase [Actinomycetota bacterium]|nr:3-dehydroquinate synthase [Actinomycetota bacterium]